ncbi:MULTISPECIES: DUF397 domain-containing protein [Streptomyces]|uniref:DUF397 domain-containing protein n=2 Tax=Streptomyces TaxID=1883 RepID=A0A1D8G279_9ACTN|nr:MULTISPECIES: DUF397 domain-containing protein [Streptomyces]AOT59541.1 hypothetical protein A4G23_02383 [Streptomyces rubrolavendulae]KAF0651024.1 hypothetical protein K701_04425 [Streptomyces fradiae ATCC 10745 = DSM 40063]OSY52176.1 hypothetical protein BG846_02186 [Streptomyces fradiae ATCC 10745 = DSM 40063]QEV12777.1 DUF397 domain-containing protein [Streptomyces fradiae ATCC 10745 = DSM 40063]UQS31965.1 DUF397 domain-containing protein [Streptomyces fradiae]
MTDDLNWFKSSYSSGQGGECVEVAFTKSSYSSDQGGECVEVAACAHAVRVRDSKDTARPGLAVAPEAWSAFVRAVG